MTKTYRLVYLSSFIPQVTDGSMTIVSNRRRMKRSIFHRRSTAFIEVQTEL